MSAAGRKRIIAASKETLGGMAGREGRGEVASKNGEFT